MKIFHACRFGLLFSLGFLMLSQTLLAGSGNSGDEFKGPKYKLRYRFEAGQTLRWQVVRRLRVCATYGGATQDTQTVDRSTKCWRVLKNDDHGNAVLEYMVEDIDMWQKMSDRDPVRYNSKTDKKPPAGFADVAKRVGRPLAKITIDPLGDTVRREALLPEPVHKGKHFVTIPLPEKAVAIGESWKRREKVMLPLENKTTKTILTQQVFTLKEVKAGVATIEVANQVLTPIHSPALEAKLIERYKRGMVRFDIDAGRILSQQIDLDRRVVGFRGADSCVHHVTRFTERLLPDKPELAARGATRR